MTCCRPPRGKRSASCSAVSDNLPYRTLERKEPAHDDCHRAPAPGSLHACFRKPEDEDRVAQRIADLEVAPGRDGDEDRKSTRLNSSHDQISYAVFCLKNK